MTETPTQKDVVALLIDQHRRIRELFASVTAAAAEDRQERFDQLRRFLAVHETAEEMVVHPRARLGEGGHGVVDARLAEEHAAKEVLSDLDHMKVSDAGFDAKLEELRTACSHTPTTRRQRSSRCC